MRCVRPVEAFQLDDGRVVFTERGGGRALFLRCGQCVGCRLSRAQAWAVRCMHEASLHELNSFVTLTYDDKHVPSDGSLCYRHFQLFVKRLRKQFACFDVTSWQMVPRYYMCGEYGEQGNRPHFHACFFGLGFPDQVYFKKSASGAKLYTSKLLEELWTFGHSLIGAVTFESAGYVARYCTKKVLGVGDFTRVNIDGETGEVKPVVNEFGHMSLKPGIGARWIERFLDDVYTQDGVFIHERKVKPPRYYDEFLKARDWSRADDVAFDRYQKSAVLLADSSADRLAAMEQVALASLKSKQRVL